MPLNIDFVQILLHLLNFVILLGGLTLLLFKPVSKFMEDRKKRFEDLARENAEKAAENYQMKQEYEEKLKNADEEIAKMQTAAEQEAAAAARTYLDNAKLRADDMIRAAEAEAEARKSQILESAHTEISELVLSAAQKLVEGTEEEDRTHELYDAFLAQEEEMLKRRKKL